MKPEMTAKRAQEIASRITSHIPTQFDIATELMDAYGDGVQNGIDLLAIKIGVQK